MTHKLSTNGFNWAKEKFSGENISVINKVQKENIPRDEITTLRKVGTLLESVDDVMTNPSLLKGQSYEYVRNILGNSKYWVNDVMYKSNRAKGWVLRERNQAGTDFTGRMIQYHPGTPRHFGGEPYWKISSGKGIFRIPIKP